MEGKHGHSKQYHVEVFSWHSVRPECFPNEFEQNVLPQIHFDIVKLAVTHDVIQRCIFLAYCTRFAMEGNFWKNFKQKLCL